MSGESAKRYGDAESQAKAKARVCKQSNPTFRRLQDWAHSVLDAVDICLSFYQTTRDTMRFMQSPYRCIQIYFDDDYALLFMVTRFQKRLSEEASFWPVAYDVFAPPRGRAPLSHPRDVAPDPYETCQRASFYARCLFTAATDDNERSTVVFTHVPTDIVEAHPHGSNIRACMCVTLRRSSLGVDDITFFRTHQPNPESRA